MKRFPNMINVQEIGKTVENRSILLYRLHSPCTTNCSNNVTKNGLWMNSLQHAREWVSAPVTQYIALKLLEEYSTTPRIKKILDTYDIHYVPVLNVDGFIYSHTNARLWRKNRRGGYGVDLNRNWLGGWGSGSSDNRNSEVYRGPSPLSEPENQAVNNYIKKYQNFIKNGVDFHSFSEVILRPFGYTSNSTPTESYLNSVGQNITNSVNQVFRKSYRNWRAVQLGLGNGLDDEFYITHKFKTSFTVELRPNSAFGGGFHLPPNQILDCAKENYQGIITLLEMMMTQ